MTIMDRNDEIERCLQVALKLNVIEIERECRGQEPMSQDGDWFECRDFPPAEETK